MNLLTHGKKMTEESKGVAIHNAFPGTDLMVQTKEEKRPQDALIQIRLWDIFESNIVWKLNFYRAHHKKQKQKQKKIISFYPQKMK